MTCVGWWHFGPTEELPRIKNQRAYREGLTALPDWRITLLLRRQGLSQKRLGDRRARRCHAREISRLGGGTVESYPEHAEGRSVSSSFRTMEPWGCSSDRAF